MLRGRHSSIGSTDIERLMQSAVPSSSSIQDLNVELVKIYDTNNVKLTLNGT